MTSKSPTSATSTQGKGSFPAPVQKTSSSPDALTAMSRPDLSSGISQNTTDSTVSFPPPQIFDVLPPLHALLLRLIASQTSTQQQQQQQEAAAPAPDNGATAAGTTTAPTSNNNSSLAPPPQNTTASTTQPPDSTTPNSSLKPDLDTKSLLTEASTVKIRIQKAKAALAELPDIDRTVEDQEREIEDLEIKIGRLKGVIGEFGRRSGGGFAGGRKLGEDVEMEMGYS